MSDSAALLEREPAEQDATPAPSHPFTDPRWRFLLVPAGALLVWGAYWVLATVTNAAVTDPRWRLAIPAAAAVCSAVAGVLLVFLGRRRPVLAADTCAALVSGSIAGLMTVALHGTKWTAYALFADGSFRFEMATRYAHHLGSVSYIYKGLPAYYPPALGWVEGRVADLAGVPGWEAVKPVALFLGLLVPLLSYGLWCRVLTPPVAAVVLVGTISVTANVQKPDEWLVLSCIVPWWLDLVRNLRAPGVRPWPVWRHGVVAGLLLLVHTFFFMPIAVASVLALAVDLVRRRRPRLDPWRAVMVVLVGLAVAAPYWGVMVLEKLHGAPTDSLQMRYTFPGANFPPLPLPPRVQGTLGLIGLVWLAWSFWRWRRGRPAPLAVAMALVLAGAVLTLVIGHLAVGLGIGILAFKAKQMVDAVYAAIGMLGLVEAARFLHDRARTGHRWPKNPVQLTAVLGAVVAVFLVQGFVSEWVISPRALVPQTTRYPDGSWPQGRHGHKVLMYPGTIRAGDPSVQQVRDAWKRASGGRTTNGAVIVTDRVDLIGTTPINPFIAWKSIYSDPLGQFAGRLHLLRQVAKCSTPGCAAPLLRHNPYDRVDGLVLERDGDWMVTTIGVDNFPHKTAPTYVAFRASAFAGPQFRRVDVGRLSVVALR